MCLLTHTETCLPPVLFPFSVLRLRLQVKSPGSLERCIAKLAIELPKAKEQENDSARFSQIDTSSATKVRQGGEELRPNWYLSCSRVGANAMRTLCTVCAVYASVDVCPW